MSSSPYQDLIDLIKQDEGFRDRVYLDTKGIPTCGWGHALQVGSTVPLEICEAFLDYDLARAERDYASLQLQLDAVRANVIRCMLFQMGLAGVRRFKRFLASVRRGDFHAAAAEMLDSKWARIDSPARARRLAQMMATGNFR